MAYTITQYTKQQAKKLGVEVKPSRVKGKKIDVFKNGKKVASVGAIGYGDYPTYIKTKGKAYADERRKAYKKDTKVTDIKEVQTDGTQTNFYGKIMSGMTDKQKKIVLCSNCYFCIRRNRGLFLF